MVFAIILISVDRCFFAFFGLFSSDFGFLYSRSIQNFYCFFTIFRVLASGLPSAKFLPGSNLAASDQSLRLYCR